MIYNYDQLLEERIISVKKLTSDFYESYMYIEARKRIMEALNSLIDEPSYCLTASPVCSGVSHSDYAVPWSANNSLVGVNIESRVREKLKNLYYNEYIQEPNGFNRFPDHRIILSSWDYHDPYPHHINLNIDSKAVKCDECQKQGSQTFKIDGKLYSIKNSISNGAINEKTFLDKDKFNDFISGCEIWTYYVLTNNDYEYKILKNEIMPSIYNLSYTKTQRNQFTFKNYSRIEYDDFISRKYKLFESKKQEMINHLPKILQEAIYNDTIEKS